MRPVVLWIFVATLSLTSGAVGSDTPPGSPSDESRRRYVLSATDFTPISGAKVTLTASRRWKELAQEVVLTDKNGGFVSDLWRHEYVHLVVEAPGFAASQSIPWYGTSHYDSRFVLLEEGVEIEGRVIANPERTLEGTVTALTGWRDRRLGDSKSYQVNIDSQGRFKVTLPAGEYRLRADIVGCPPVMSRPLDTANDPFFEFLVEPGAEPFRGTVTDYSGNPIPGASVTASYLSGARRRLTTDAVGGFVGYGAKSLQWFRVRASGYRHRPKPNISPTVTIGKYDRPEALEPKESWDFQLEPVSRVKLQVKAAGAESSTRVAQAKSSGQSSSLVATECPIGAQVEVPVVGSRLTIELLGSKKVIAAPFEALDSGELDSEEVTDVGSIEFHLRSIEVRVKNSQGQPIPQGDVYFSSELLSSFILASTHATMPWGVITDGSSTVVAVLGTDYRVFVRCPGYHIASAELSADALALDVVLQPLPKLVGRVIDPNGSAIDNARVSLEGSTRPASAIMIGSRSGTQELWGWPTKTGVAGQFELLPLPCLPGSEYQVAPALVVRAPGYDEYSVQWSDPSDGERFDFGTITLTPRVSVQGTVSDERGAPVPGMKVSIRPETKAHSGFADISTRTRRDGTYSLSVETAGRYWLALECGERFEKQNPRRVSLGGSSSRQDWLVETRPNEPTLATDTAQRAVGTLVVDVTTEGTQLPQGLSLGRGEWGSRFSEGTLTATRVPAGLQRVWIHSRARSPLGPFDVWIRQGETSRIAAHYPAQDPPLTVEVLDVRGRPIEGARVTSGKDGPVVTDSNGTAVLLGGPPGFQILKVSADGLAPKSLSRRFLETRDGVASLVLRPSALLSLVVNDRSGEPVPWVKVRIFSEVVTRDSSRTSVEPVDASGRWSRRLVTGAYRIVVGGDASDPFDELHVCVEPGEDRVIELVQPAHRLVRGQLLRRGSPVVDLPSVSIQFRHSNGHWTARRIVTIGADGRFEARTYLPPSRARIVLDGVMIECAEVDATFRFDLEDPPTMASGRVVNGEGASQPGILGVWICGVRDYYGMPKQTGRYEIPAPIPGFYQVVGHQSRDHDWMIPTHFRRISSDSMLDELRAERAVPLLLSYDQYFLPYAIDSQLSYVATDGSRTALRFSPHELGLLWPESGGDCVAFVRGQVARFSTPSFVGNSELPITSLELQPGGLLTFWGTSDLFRALVGTVVSIEPIGHEVPEVFLRHRFELTGIRLPLPEGRYRVTLMHEGRTLGGEIEIIAGVESEMTLR